jgi:hypothetical protein
VATEQPGFSITREAAADLSAKQYTFVKVDSSGKAAAAGTAGEVVVGVLQNKPSASGQAATVVVTGVSKVYAGGSIDEGDLIKTANDGQALAAVKGTTNTGDAGGASDPLVGSYVVGIALSAGGDGELVSVLLLHQGVVATTAA